MGVRGLTSYIARHAELYLTPYELHDCNLVIDGDNLACNLYKDVTGAYSAFGGDYDDYYRAVVEFFHVLAECNVHAYVLLDGGYEERKLRTVGKRLRGKISVIKHINPNGSAPVFPIMMKEVFIDAVRDCGVPLMRCIFEADDELAALGRKLNCPVLSYDSDFYIHNVRYIPLVTLTVKAHTKLRKNVPKEQEDRKLRKNEAKSVEKRTKANRIIDGITSDNKGKQSAKPGTTYKYLDCCMYRIENLIARRSLSKEKLPLFAALLGNDYIARSSFQNFIKVGMGRAGRSKKMNQQQRRIRIILEWLKKQTAESALEQILTRLKKGQRESLLAQVKAATAGYSNEKCISYDYFLANYEKAIEDFTLPTAEESDYDEQDEYEEDEWEEVEEGDEEVEEDAEEDESASATEESTKNTNGTQPDTDKSPPDIATDNDTDEAARCGSEDDEELDFVHDDADKLTEFPTWFLVKVFAGHLPRFFVDLLHLRKYINSPQIEHFPYDDAHAIALPILIHSFTLLHSVQQERENAPNEASPVEFIYLTRATKITNIRYSHYAMETTPIYDFKPHAPDPQHLRELFQRLLPAVDVKTLFCQLQLLPKDLQLYFLAIVYWLQKSKHCDLIHLHALLVCLVVLRIIDAQIPVVRELKAFQKRFGKIIKKERAVRDKEALEGTARQLKEEVKKLSISKRMAHVPKSDCYLVQDQLLKHFHMQEIFKKKYDLYSTTVLHAFAEFQSIVFQLYSLNALLDFPYANPHLGQLYCGVFLYNLYDLLHARLDVKYHVQHFIFQDSQLMFDFYNYLFDSCSAFVPASKFAQSAVREETVSKKVLKKRKKLARKLAGELMKVCDPYADMLDRESDKTEQEDEDFFDINNKFSTFLIK